MALSKGFNVIFMRKINQLLLKRVQISIQLEERADYSLFKKDDHLCKTNYRPAAVLPAINNVCEWLLASQVLYFENILSDYYC